MTHEKRKYPRIVPGINVFAALGYGNTFAGKINEISTGGLSFEHIVSFDKKMTFPNAIDIFVPETSFYLSDLPCTKVYDMPLHQENSFTAPFVLKRCGVAFYGLSSHQMHELDNFLQYHTAGLNESAIAGWKHSIHLKLRTPNCELDLM